VRRLERVEEDRETAVEDAVEHQNRNAHSPKIAPPAVAETTRMISIPPVAKSLPTLSYPPLTKRGPAHYLLLRRTCPSALEGRGALMVKVALLARLVAKPGKEEEVAAFLSGALPLAQAEEKTIVWFALRLSKSEFGVFDAFPDDAGRKAHLSGPIPAPLMEKAGQLLAEPQKIDNVDPLAAKLSK